MCSILLERAEKMPTVPKAGLGAMLKDGAKVS